MLAPVYAAAHPAAQQTLVCNRPCRAVHKFPQERPQEPLAPAGDLRSSANFPWAVVTLPPMALPPWPFPRETSAKLTRSRQTQEENEPYHTPPPSLSLRYRAGSIDPSALSDRRGADGRGRGALGEAGVQA